MLLGAAVLVILAVTHDVSSAAHVHHTAEPPTTPRPDADRLKDLEQVTEQLARQLILQQLYVEEITRSSGDSGLKQLRMRKDGTKPYFTDSFLGHSVAAIHDHSNLERTAGMGELIAVLNGLEFRTRHNDYKVKMPMNNKTFNGLVDIPFPPVPPSVLSKHTVPEQAAELREYFKAWNDQDPSHRDYRPYFKPVLCVLEGAWTLDEHISEPFSSDRHALDASSWFDLQEKIRYTSMTGDRLNSQNFAFLPTMITNVTGGKPTFAQWNYRIFCHPLKAEVDKTHLIPVDDLAHRIANDADFQKYQKTRMVHYRVMERPGHEKFMSWTPLDDWMYEIPGRDNYGSHITDETFGLPKMVLDMSEKINVGHFHRRWKVGEHDAMGDTVGKRGFADRNMFVAETTQPRIAPTHAKVCGRSPTTHHHVCTHYQKRMTYAIPLELIFLTPLQSWRPYDIVYYGKFNHPEAAPVTADHRNGGTNITKAYNGTHSKAFYFTPVEFFSGSEVSHDPADTTKAATGVLDRQGNLRLMKSSGIRTQLPEIAGVGSLRIRYPIMPMHAEGSPIWKEMEAMRDVLMNMEAYSKYIVKPPEGLKSYSAQPSHNSNHG